jgi:PAS domain S-box-containing protein
MGMVEGYVEKVILPGVYKLAEIYPLSYVLAGFVLIFILMVTLLATIPMAALTREGVQKEAQRRALTIARQLATMSERFVSTGAEGNIRTDLAEAEEGVVSALVVSQEDGHIIAPLSKADSFSNDQFVALARKHDDAPYYFSDLPDSHLGVSVPIHGFSQDLGQTIVVADAVVIYKMDAQNWSSAIALFARILIIALLLGSLLYFLLYRLICHPIIEASRELDQALRGEKDVIQTRFDFDVLKKFIENINSAISRMGRSQEGAHAIVPIDRAAEASNLVRIISDPTLALDENGRFLQVNGAFEELIGMRLLTLQGQDLQILQDQALKLNIQDLLDKAKVTPGNIVTNQLEIGGINYELDMQVSPHEQSTQRFHYALATLKKRNEG